MILALVSSLPWLATGGPSAFDPRAGMSGCEYVAIPTGLDPAQEQAIGSSSDGAVPVQGDFLFRIATSFTYLNNDVSDSNIFRLEAGLSYFLTNSSEVGLDLRPGFQRVAFDSGGGTEEWFVRLGTYYHWNVELSKVLVGFIGPQVEWTTFDSRGGPSDSEFGYGFELGVRYWLQPNVALELEPRFTRRSYGGAVGDENEIQTLFGVTIRL